MNAALILLAFSCALFGTHVTRVSSDMQTEYSCISYTEEKESTKKCEDAAMHRAIRWNDSALVTQLVKEGLDAYAMFLCVKENNLNLTQTLIDYNANTIRLSRDGESYIHLAARHGSVSVMNVLLEDGLPPDTVILHDQTPLAIAVEKNNIDIIKTLIYHNSYINRVTKFGESYLHVAVRNNSTHTVKHLLENGVFVDGVSLNDETPLGIAVEKNNLNIMNTLIRNNANISRVSKLGESYLHLSVRSNSTPAVQFLLENGVPVDTVSQKDETPLTIAVQMDSYEITETLLQYNPDMKRRTQRGQTYCGIAFANKAGHAFRALGNNCKPVDERDSYGYNAIFWAVGKDDIDTVSALAELGADLTQVYEKHKLTLLHRAAQKGSTRVTRWLVQRGINVNVLNVRGWTPLHEAARWDRLAEVKLLLELGAHINSRNIHGHTPLRFAKYHHHTDIVEYLKSKGGVE